MRIAETLEIFFPNEKTEVLINPLLFGDFKYSLDEDKILLYEDYESYENVQKIFENVILQYNIHINIYNIYTYQAILKIIKNYKIDFDRI